MIFGAVFLIFCYGPRRLKAGFSSAGGCASVNHQHYHVYYLEEKLYLETAVILFIIIIMCLLEHETRVV